MVNQEESKFFNLRKKKKKESQSRNRWMISWLNCHTPKKLESQKLMPNIGGNHLNGNL